MNKDFPRIITMLRKEKNLSQKQASADLGISQALLSHYEKGIRECGLDFVLKVSEYYNVSCDFLLGRTPERSGATLSFDDIPDDEETPGDNTKGNALVPLMNKKILCNSLAVVFDMLANAKSRQLTADVSNYLMLAVYNVFRTLYSANPKNHQTMFSINKALYQGYSDSYMSRYSTKFRYYADAQSNVESTAKLRDSNYSSEILSQEYEKQSSSLFNLIQHAESKIRTKPR
ncbi:MAG: helix-turn-helix transcriptional regulator [Clostridia bacterium]|nr:helix-turn-helix transcriptional regulator [Clostridia bacterium]